MGQNIFWSVEDDNKDHGDNAILIKSVDSEAEIMHLKTCSAVLSRCEEKKDEPTAVILDYRLGKTEAHYVDGIRALGAILDAFPDTPVFMLTGKSSAEHVLDPLNLLLKYNLLTGYFEKNMQDRERLKTHLQNLLEMQRQNSRMLKWFGYIDYMEGHDYRMLGSTGWRYRDLSRMAMSDAPILIQGPTGSGKELAARRIHAESFRNEANFVPVNCSAIPATLFADTFFGHKKGAFTDAQFDTDGHFQAADGGTLFLDEVGDLELPAQAKLLRILDRGVYHKIGENIPRTVNVRIISASNKDLQDMVRRGEFRNDLYSRLNGMSYRTYGLSELDDYEKAEELELFIRRCLAEAYEEQKKLLKADIAKRARNKDQNSAIHSEDGYGITKIAADMLSTRLKSIKKLFKEEADVRKHPHKRTGWQNKAWILLGIPCKIPKRKWREFTAYDWPRNYREIRSAVQTAVGKGGWEHVQLEDLSRSDDESVESHLDRAAELYLPDSLSEDKTDGKRSLDDFVGREGKARTALIQRAYAICHGSRKCMARVLDVKADTLSKDPTYRKLQEQRSDE